MTAEDRARRAAQRQLDAYNARDAKAFALCFHPDVRLFDLRTHEETGRGREHLEARYGELFERCPDLHAMISNRSVVGNVAFDQELVTGMRDEPVHAMAMYEVDDDELITQVWFVVR